jgi:putative SOS response-associated peptidase YedK
MCGRFAMDDATNAAIEDLVAEHGYRVLDKLADYLPRWNIKPTEPVPVALHSTKLGHGVVAAARWGYVPPWAKSMSTAPRTTFNARSEAALHREDDGRPSMWHTPLTKGQRCLFFASGYYEWSGPKSARTPHWIHPPQQVGRGGVLAFAGLYGWWADPALPPDAPGRMRLTATMLTMPAVPELEAIHDRNPVAVPHSAWAHWLDPATTGDQGLVDGLVAEARPVLAGLREWEVARFGTSADGPELTQPIRQP